MQSPNEGTMDPVKLCTRDEITPAMAVDYAAVEVEGHFNQSEWADERGTSQQRVSENVRGVKRLLQD